MLYVNNKYWIFSILSFRAVKILHCSTCWKINVFMDKYSCRRTQDAAIADAPNVHATAEWPANCCDVSFLFFLLWAKSRHFSLLHGSTCLKAESTFPRVIILEEWWVVLQYISEQQCSEGGSFNNNARLPADSLSITLTATHQLYRCSSPGTGVTQNENYRV